jgi:hypothetical protein
MRDIDGWRPPTDGELQAHQTIIAAQRRTGTA